MRRSLIFIRHLRSAREKEEEEEEQFSETAKWPPNAETNVVLAVSSLSWNRAESREEYAGIGSDRRARCEREGTRLFIRFIPGEARGRRGGEGRGGGNFWT